jgi:hypothetical protein
MSMRDQMTRGLARRGAAQGVYPLKKQPQGRKMKKMGAPLEFTDAQNVIAETRRKLNIGQR